MAEWLITSLPVVWLLQLNSDNCTISLFHDDHYCYKKALQLRLGRRHGMQIWNYLEKKKASIVSLPVLWSEWLRHLCGRLSSQGLFSQDYPIAGRELESRWSLRLRQERTHWAVEEEWPVFIKLMNVWSHSAAPWWAIWISERSMVRC